MEEHLGEEVTALLKVGQHSAPWANRAHFIGIAAGLVAEEPSSITERRDLVCSHTKIGDTELGLGDGATVAAAGRTLPANAREGRRLPRADRRQVLERAKARSDGCRGWVRVSFAPAGSAGRSR